MFDFLHSLNLHLDEVHGRVLGKNLFPSLHGRFLVAYILFVYFVALVMMLCLSIKKKKKNPSNRTRYLKPKEGSPKRHEREKKEAPKALGLPHNEEDGMLSPHNLGIKNHLLAMAKPLFCS